MKQESILQTLADLESAAAARNLSMRRLLLTAKVAPSTWFRWRKGDTSPTVRTLRRIERTLAELK